MGYRRMMDDTKIKSPTLEEATTPQPDSDDPAYLAWKEATIRAALKEADENPDDVLTQEQMREKYGPAG